MTYYLDISDSNELLIKKGEERFNLSKKQDVIEIIKLLNE